MCVRTLTDKLRILRIQASSLTFDPSQSWAQFAQTVKGLVVTNRKSDAANLCLQAADFVHSHPELFPTSSLAWIKFEWGFRSQAATYDPQDEYLINANRLAKKIVLLEPKKAIAR